MRFVLIPYSLFKEVFTKAEVKNDLVSGQLKSKKVKTHTTETEVVEKIEQQYGKNKATNQKR